MEKRSKTMNDPPTVPRSKEQVNHPQHYGGDTTYETIKVLRAWGLDNSFCLGNVVKYISRAGKKDSTKQDLEKAKWYLEKQLEWMEEEDNAQYGT